MILRRSIVLVLPEEEFDSFRPGRHHPVLPRLDVLHVQGDGPAERQAPVFCVLGDLESVRVLEERLRRDAAPVEAGASERLLPFYHDDAQPQLRRPDGSRVAARPGADDDQVVLAGHGCSFRFSFRMRELTRRLP
jgi:hypothetical protein